VTNKTSLLSAAATIASGIVLIGGLAVPALAWKDTGPGSAACDEHQKGGDAWRACATAAGPTMSDQELFYAGYWLARQGSYREALGFLERTQTKDARTLTYIGFATRKLGAVEEAMGHYKAALSLDPNYSVARAYMGEGFLVSGDVAAARGQLAEIGRRCGQTCAEYGDLAGHIAYFEAARRKG